MLNKQIRATALQHQTNDQKRTLSPLPNCPANYTEQQFLLFPYWLFSLLAPNSAAKLLQIFQICKFLGQESTEFVHFANKTGHFQALSRIFTLSASQYVPASERVKRHALFSLRR